MSGDESDLLIARRAGIDTKSEFVVFMHRDCGVCRSEGLAAHNRVLLRFRDRHIIATLFQVTGDLLDTGQAALSESAWLHLGLSDGDKIGVEHPEPLDSFSHVRGRIYNHRLNENALFGIIHDVVGGEYSDIHISSFLTACAARPLNHEEILGLTRAMVNTGDRIAWSNTDVIVDKHSVGGLPGNRTTPIIVSIVAALGLTMPKTSSRAITSPSGTADTMETLAPVALDIATIHDVIAREGGCIAWGGSMRLSPADDILIRVERALDIDTEGQMIASILSKKIAAGSNHLVIDMPIGPTAKVRTLEAAKSLSDGLKSVAEAFGIKIRILEGDGRQPIGRGIGPALEAFDILSVLQCAPDAPRDLRDRAVKLAGALLELAGKARDGEGSALAAHTLDNGDAWKKFQGICDAQGGMRTPPRARYTKPLTAPMAGRVDFIDNRKIAQLAKLAGAPDAKAAGLVLHVRDGDTVSSGQPLCTVHAEAKGELAYALNYAAAHHDIIRIRHA